MEAMNYTVRIRPAAEGGYWAEVPALPGCFTQGETLEEVTLMIRESMELYLARLLYLGESFPVERRVKKGFTFPVTVRPPRPS
jgi:predicted RNase H-like HicB family nuclease